MRGFTVAWSLEKGSRYPKLFLRACFPEQTVPVCAETFRATLDVPPLRRKTIGTRYKELEHS